MAITRNEFAARILHNMRIDSRKRAVTCLVGWMMSESGDHPCNGKPGKGAKYNPLNTTLDSGKVCVISDYNTTGVKNYASETCGIKATSGTLELSYYTDVARALKRVNLPGWRTRFAQAVGNSPWGTSAAGVEAGIKAAEADNKWGTITVG